MRPITSTGRRTRGSHAGFTLAEVLVTLAIISVMAAVLLPALNSQLAKGDTARLASDLTSLQTGVQAFFSDVHRYPANFTEMTSAVTSGSTDINGTTIPSTYGAKWQGPYLTRNIGNTAGGVVSQTFTSTAGGNGSNYVTVTVTGISLGDYNNIEAILDEGVSGVTSTTGSVRYSGSTLTFLALPIQ